MGDGLLDELVGAVDVRQRLLQVDDVDAVALGEDEALHLRVPAAGLVPEVDAALEQLPHGDDGHGRGHSSSPRAAAPGVTVRQVPVRFVATAGWTPVPDAPRGRASGGRGPWRPVRLAAESASPPVQGGRMRACEFDPAGQVVPRVYAGRPVPANRQLLGSSTAAPTAAARPQAAASGRSLAAGQPGRVIQARPRLPLVALLAALLWYSRPLARRAAPPTGRGAASPGRGVAGWSGRWRRRRPVVRAVRRADRDRWPPGTAASTWRRSGAAGAWPPVDGVVAFAGSVAGRGVVASTSTARSADDVRAGGGRVRRGRSGGAGGHCSARALPRPRDQPRAGPCLHWGLRVGPGLATYQDPLSLLGLLPVRLLPYGERLSSPPRRSHRRPVRRPRGGRCPLRPPPTADR